MYYSLFEGDLPVYELNDDGSIKHIEIDGEMIPVETGETRLTYSTPVVFDGNIMPSGGRAEAEAFGLNVGDYEAVLVVEKNKIPITETSKIWHETVPVYNEDGTVNYFEADYTIVKPSLSINSVKYALKKVVK